MGLSLLPLIYILLIWTYIHTFVDQKWLPLLTPSTLYNILVRSWNNYLISLVQLQVQLLGMFISSGQCSRLRTPWEFSAGYGSRILGHMSVVNNNVIKDMTVQVSERMTAHTACTLFPMLRLTEAPKAPLYMSLSFKQTKLKLWYWITWEPWIDLYKALS